MSLHVDRYETAGSGAPLLLIHGWGMHGGMWEDAANKLAQHYRVMAVDLPGHGLSRTMKGEEPVSAFSLDFIVDQLSDQFDGPLAVCGWSLGGQVALRWALRHPQQVERLVLVASTPCFVRLDGWEHALSVEILEEFAANLQQDYAQTLRRFLSLQMRGSEQERAVLALLRESLFSRGTPDLYALEAGLEILRDSDQRGALPEVTQPTLVLAGGRDTLIPRQAAQYLAGQIPGARLAMIEGAAHAPFLSHPDEFVMQLMSFLKGDPQIT